MTIKKENAKVGIINKDRQPKKQKTITSVVEKRDKKQEKDGEAGVDPQVGQLHTMPDMHTYPKEPKKKTSKK